MCVQIDLTYGLRCWAQTVYLCVCVWVCVCVCICVCVCVCLCGCERGTEANGGGAAVCPYVCVDTERGRRPALRRFSGPKIQIDLNYGRRSSTDAVIGAGTGRKGPLLQGPAAKMREGGARLSPPRLLFIYFHFHVHDCFVASICPKAISCLPAGPPARK